MKYSVTYSSNFVCRLDHTVFCIHKSIKYKLNSNVVILHRCFNNILILSCWLMCKDRTINPLIFLFFLRALIGFIYINR